VSSKEKEVTDIGQLKYDQDGLIPAIIQDVHTREVLMMAYMNRDSLQKTLETGNTWFWSRSRQCYWQKGESSGHTQEVQSVYYDCDADTLLIKVVQNGVACHTGNYTCFFNLLQEKDKQEGDYPVNQILSELTWIIRERKEKRPEGSYVSSLLEGGKKKLARKLGEEALETVLALEEEDDEELIRESADLLFHLLVMLESRDMDLGRVLQELASRRSAAGES